MGSFYMNCAVTRHPFCYDQEDAVLIPILVKYSSDRPIYMHDNCSIFPLFVNAKYHDYGQFEVEEGPMSERVLDLLAAALENGVTGGRRRGDDEDEEIDIENFNWDTFFDLTHENKSCSYGRISYVAIHKKVFDRIISDYTLYGKLDTSIEGYTPENYGSYGFDHYFAEKIKSMADKKVKADAVSKDYAERIAALTAKELTAHLAKGNDESSFTPSTDLMLLGFRRDMKVNEVLSEPNYGEHAYLQANQLAPELPSLGDEEFLNAQKVNFFSAFMAGINMPWAESVYAGQECDTDGYKVLRNCYADLTVQSTITHFEENCVSKDDVVIDKNDKILMELMDKLNHIDVEYIKE
jgi:hypothetical protein